jgi:cyclopropane-fatty-acyl-phospholipid synthase
VDIRLQDYREIDEKFDRVVSIAMFEAVGHRYYRTFMKVVDRCLKDDGLFVLHTIGNNHSSAHGDPWTEKYIFPIGILPSIRQIGAAIEGQFVMEDWHNFGADYDRTLMAWWANFDAAWPELRDKYGERFYRMWRFYLQVFAAMFRVRNINLWQLVLSPDGVRGGYRRIS